MDDYSEILETAKAAALAAGDFVREGRKEGLTVEAKSAVDFVSDKDREAEDMIRRTVRARFPEHRFFGEESVYDESPQREQEDIRSFGREEFVWVVDPIDGTVNYIRDYPQYVISIAVIHRREIVAGVICDPFRSELFHAVKGGGAFCNGRPVRVSEAGSAAESILNTSIANGETRVKMTPVIPYAAQQFQSMRIWNCTALGLASVACGRLDGSYEAGIHLWDMAAGILLVREAGGEITRLDGSPWDLSSCEVLATNGKIHRETAAVLTAALGG